MKVLNRFTFVVLISFFVFGCGIKSGLLGKVVDGKGEPIANLKIIAKQVNAVPGYEKFETTTDSDGKFKFSRIFPSSKYSLVPQVKDCENKLKITLKIQGEGQTLELTSPIKIRFMVKKDGTVLDTRTGLMWAVKDNGKNINWHNAKNYCENYRGGGYTDWRLPTQDELADLHDRNRKNHYDDNYRYNVPEVINRTGCCAWASEMRDPKIAGFNFTEGKRIWHRPSSFGYIRALPVRSAN